MTQTTLHIRVSDSLKPSFRDVLRTYHMHLKQWRLNARTRRELATLDEHLLKDIGLSRADAIVESHKPFWEK